ncbi:hypothetical protein AVEN_207123-1 [Araneus ventricosus]|uniref:Uncharacterized protein n=1 Tax=Araneus ventricosus TaxID=182803 RepID=A0A4Y2JF16_ARAVE|nr:hypothetical protein AVEN_207123-1 [Araneus ventricosus]
MYKTSTGKRKPDLDAILNDRAFVIDSQVVGEAADLKRANQRKISYYRDSDGIIEQIKKQHMVNCVSVMATTINLRGCWSSPSFDDLVTENNMLSANDVTVLLQSWKVASQQCRSYGWEEGFTR